MSARRNMTPASSRSAAPTPASAASDLEGYVGTGNRGEDEPTQGEEATAQRAEDQGATPTSEKSQAALKGGEVQTEGVAGEVEAATDDETPANDAIVGTPNTGDPSDIEVPEELSKPAGEVVSEALSDDDDEDDK